MAAAGASREMPWLRAPNSAHAPRPAPAMPRAAMALNPTARPGNFTLDSPTGTIATAVNLNSTNCWDAVVRADQGKVFRGPGNCPAKELTSRRY